MSISTAPLSTTTIAEAELSTRRPIRGPNALIDHRKRDKLYFFLTIPGIIRLFEILLSTLHVGCFGYYCTFYNLPEYPILSPVLLASTREAFFLVVNIHTLITTLTIITSSMISAKSHDQLLGSLSLFLFDFLQFLLIIASAAANLLLYMEKGAKAAYNQTLTTRQGLAITGIILGCMHLLGSIYDLSIFVQKAESIPEEETET